MQLKFRPSGPCLLSKATWGKGVWQEDGLDWTGLGDIARTITKNKSERKKLEITTLALPTFVLNEQ